MRLGETEKRPWHLWSARGKFLKELLLEDPYVGDADYMREVHWRSGPIDAYWRGADGRYFQYSVNEDPWRQRIPGGVSLWTRLSLEPMLAWKIRRDRAPYLLLLPPVHMFCDLRRRFVNLDLFIDRNGRLMTFWLNHEVLNQEGSILVGTSESPISIQYPLDLTVLRDTAQQQDTDAEVAQWVLVGLDHFLETGKPLVAR